MEKNRRKGRKEGRKEGRRKRDEGRKYLGRGKYVDLDIDTK